MSEIKQRKSGVTRRMTIKNDGKELEIHSTMLGYPITFEITDELRDFLRKL